MSSAYRYETNQGENEYEVSPLKTLSVEKTNKSSNFPKKMRNHNTVTNFGNNYYLRTSSYETHKNNSRNYQIKLPLLIDKNNISSFYKMKQYKVALPQHRDKKEITEEDQEKKVNNLLDKYTVTSYKNSRSVNKNLKNDVKKYDFEGYMKLQNMAEIKFRPRFGDSSLELVKYIKKVSSIRKQVVKDLLDEIKNAENRYNTEKPEVDSEFRSKEKYLIDNRWKNSFSLEEYQQFFMKNLKGKISSLNYRQMLKRFRQISLMCFCEGNNTHSIIKKLNYVD